MLDSMHIICYNAIKFIEVGLVFTSLHNSRLARRCKHYKNYQYEKDNIVLYRILNNAHCI